MKIWCSNTARRSGLNLTLMSVLLGLMSACSSAPHAAPDIKSNSPSLHLASGTYRLAPGDHLDIQVFGEENLSGEYIVSPDGVINFPLVGRIAAAGSTVTYFETALRAALARGYLVDPKLRALVSTYQSIYVEGQVNKQGEYPYTPGLTVQQAITLAGGLTRFAAEKFYLQRRGLGPEKRERVTPDTFVFPGDQISVGERLF